MPRLKQIIKKDNLGEFGKQVVDSLIPKQKHSQKETTHELMRCKIEILEGYEKYKLIDSFIINTNSLDDTIVFLIKKDYRSMKQVMAADLFLIVVAF